MEVIPAFHEAKMALAGQIALGIGLEEARRALDLPPDVVAACLTASDWGECVRASLPSIEDVRDMMVAAAPAAAMAQIRQLQSSDEETRGRAARDILDRAGLTPVKKVQVQIFRPDVKHSRLIEQTVLELTSAGHANPSVDAAAGD